MPASPRSEKQRRILDAAREICSEKGFEATRMDEIAGRAGVSKGTLYNFFPSKEDLFIDTVLASYQRFGGLLPAVDDPGVEPRKRLEALAESLAGGFDEISHQILLAHQAWSVVLRSPAARDRVIGALRDIYRGFTNSLADILGAGVASGSFRSDLDIDVMTATWIATVDGLLYRASFDDPDRSPLASSEGVRTCLGWLMEHTVAEPEAAAAGTHHAPPVHSTAPAEEPPV